LKKTDLNERQNRHDRGMVLVMTLWTLAILALLLLVLFQSTNLLTANAQAQKDEAVGEALGNGAIYAVARELAKQRDLSVTPDQARDYFKAAPGQADDSDARKRGEELGIYLVEPNGWKVSRCDAEDSDLAALQGKEWRNRQYAVCQVTAEDAKAAINGFTAENWLRLPGIDKELANRIMAYIARHGNRLTCVEQLLVFPELRGAAFNGEKNGINLKNELTTFSSGKLYVNRATTAAIAAALDINPERAGKMAEAVARHHYFMNPADVQQAAGAGCTNAGKVISLVCNSYRIKAFAVIRGKMFRYEAVAVFSDKRNFTVAYQGEF